MIQAILAKCIHDWIEKKKKKKYRYYGRTMF